MKPYYAKSMNDLHRELSSLISADMNTFNMFMTFAKSEDNNYDSDEEEKKDEREDNFESGFLFDLLKKVKDALKKAPLSSQNLEDRFKIAPTYTYFISPCLKLFFHELENQIDNDSCTKKE